MYFNTLILLYCIINTFQVCLFFHVVHAHCSALKSSGADKLYAFLNFKVEEQVVYEFVTIAYRDCRYMGSIPFKGIFFCCSAINPPGPGRMVGHNFRDLCLSVPSICMSGKQNRTSILRNVLVGHFKFAGLASTFSSYVGQ